MSSVKANKFGRELPKSSDFLKVGERKIVSEGMQELLSELSEASSLDAAVSGISEKVQRQGFQIPDKLLSLSPEAPRMGQVLSAHILTPTGEGTPHIAMDVKIFKPFDSELFSIQYRYQNPQIDPAMIEVEALCPPNTDVSDVVITRRTRSFDETTKWGKPEEDVEFLRSDDALGALQAISKDALSLLFEERA